MIMGGKNPRIEASRSKKVKKARQFHLPDPAGSVEGITHLFSRKRVQSTGGGGGFLWIGKKGSQRRNWKFLAEGKKRKRGLVSSMTLTGRGQPPLT